MCGAARGAPGANSFPSVPNGMAGALLNTLRLAKAGVVLASHSVRFVPKNGPEPLPFKQARIATLPESLAKGSVVASDAFFPFADGLEAAAAAGVTAVIQPGGSIRDAEVIAAADKAGLAMVFTGMRHFRH